MKPVEKLQSFFAVILEEAEKNPEFARRLFAAVAATEPVEKQAVTTPSGLRRRRRRSPAVLDPFSAYEAGEERLREGLAALNVEQLKDIVSEYSMDSARLALKWKKPERLIELIVLTVKTRLKKGDAFRMP